MSSESVEEEVTLPKDNALSSDLRSYLPNTFPERETEIDKLMSALNPASHGWKPNNCEVIGPAGQGKTAVVTALMETLRQLCDVTPLYVDCTGCQVDTEVWERILKQAQIVQQPHLPRGDTDLQLSQLITQAENTIREIGGVIIVVLDNFDLKESVNSLLYQLSRFSVDDAKLSSIVISENPGFRNEAERDTMGTWSPTRVNFQQYDQEALVSILQRRVELLEKDCENVMTETLESVAERVVDEFGGSARAVIEIYANVRSAITTAENIGEEDIEKAVGQYRNNLMMSEIGRSDISSKAVVVAVMREAAATKGQPTVEEVYSTYSEVTEETGVQQFAKATFRDELKTWIEAEVLRETPDGIIPEFERELLYNALLENGGTQLKTHMPKPEY